MMRFRENIIDSNIDWLGKVPSDWKIVKLKYALANIPYPIVDGPFGTQLKADEYTESGIPLVRISNLDYKGNLTLDDIRFISVEKALELERSKIRLNDVIIGKTGATIGKSGLNDKIEYGIVSSSCLKVSVDESILIPRFFKYYVTSSNFQNIILQTASGSTRDTINITPMANLEVVLPSVDEQLQIVKYLDHQTAIIDQIIQQKEKLIELLKEKRQAIINEAISKGLNPNAQMKKTGIEWLGEVPEDWNISKMKHLGHFINGYAFKSDEFLGEGKLRVIKISNIQHMQFDWSDESYVDERYLKEDLFCQVKRNDLVLALTRPIISTGIKASIIDFDEPMVLNQRNALFRPNSNVLMEWIYFTLLSHQFIEQFDSKIDKTGQQPNISTTDISNISITLPPLIKQKQICNTIKVQVDKIINLEKQILSAKDKLKEYRQSIISEAVTGKIDLRDWQFSKRQTA